MALTLIQGLKFVANVAEGLTAGGALYITVVEHPSRRQLPVKSLWEQWGKSFNRAALYMPFTGILSTAAATALYFLDNSDMRNFWLASPVIFLMVTIYTFTMIIPEVNVMLDDKIIEKKGERWVREAIDRWSRRHFLRTLLNGVNCAILMYTTLKSS